MSVVHIMPAPSPCPVCGRAPDIDECGPLPRGTPHLGWYAGCYSVNPEEHFVGVNDDTKLGVIRAWNAEVSKIARGDFEGPATDFSVGQQLSDAKETK